MKKESLSPADVSEGAGQASRETGRTGRKESKRFDFDAPKIKDFTSKEYQKQKRAIEKILREFGSPGEAHDPSKTKREKAVQIGLGLTAIRKCAVSQDGSASKARGAGADEAGMQSIDEQWFEMKEKEGVQEESVYTEISTTMPGTPTKKLISADLFDSGEEKDVLILPQLKVIATPPIKKTRTRSPAVSTSTEFTYTDIQELSKLSRDGTSP
ncbi:hypothetical protein NECID01_0474 [Nematocida sp. AWRm77]|nr:hypothetical protein NECID01_0474 [Nematocida sp. AWRm77]